MKKRFIVFLAMLSGSLSAQAQTSVFEDSQGESAFKAFTNSITINSSDPNISFDFNALRRRPENARITPGFDKFNRLGFLIKVKADEGITTLKNEDGFLIDGQLGAYVGFKKSASAKPVNPNDPGQAHETYLSGNLNIDRSNVYDLNRTTDIVYDKGALGWKVEAGRFGHFVAQFFLFEQPSDILYGYSINVGQKTNIDELNPNDVFINSNTTSGITAVTSKTAFNIVDYKNNVIHANINGDIAYLVNHASATIRGNDIPSVLAAFHMRIRYSEENDIRFNPAAGLYIGKKGAPQDIITGINLQVIDLFNSQNEDTNAWQRLSINLNAGFKL